MYKVYFGFAIADSMFSSECMISKRVIHHEEVKTILEETTVESCINPSHAATIAAAKMRYGINPKIPDVPPIVNLLSGDTIIVMGVRGLPRLTERHEYTEDEVAHATFNFSRYTVM